jgi:hypothetical protein
MSGSNPLADLTAAVAADQTVEGSAVTLIQGLATQLAALPSTPALEALVTQLNQNATTLAAAVAANTPAASAANRAGATNQSVKHT